MSRPKILNWYIKDSQPRVGQICVIYYDKLFDFPQEHYKFVDVRARYYGELFFSIEKDGLWSPLYDLGEYRMDELFRLKTKFDQHKVNEKEINLRIKEENKERQRAVKEAREKEARDVKKGEVREEKKED